MPRYLFEASCSPQGVEGISNKVEVPGDAVADMAEALGAKLESFYFTFGDVDELSCPVAPKGLADVPHHVPNAMQ
jgi:uncharacterized protein with GYD domain